MFIYHDKKENRWVAKLNVNGKEVARCITLDYCIMTALLFIANMKAVPFQ